LNRAAAMPIRAPSDNFGGIYAGALVLIRGLRVRGEVGKDKEEVGGQKSEVRSQRSATLGGGDMVESFVTAGVRHEMSLRKGW